MSAAALITGGLLCFAGGYLFGGRPYIERYAGVFLFAIGAALIYGGLQ